MPSAQVGAIVGGLQLYLLRFVYYDTLEYQVAGTLQLPEPSQQMTQLLSYFW